MILTCEHMDEISARKIASFSQLGHRLQVVDYQQARSENLGLELSEVS